MFICKLFCILNYFYLIYKQTNKQTNKTKIMKKIIQIFTVLVILFSCKDRHQDDDMLPAATQEGKNTGGALVNGQIWVAKIETPNTLPGGDNTIYNTDTVLGTFSLQIVLLKYTDSNNTISFYLVRNQDFSPGTYALDNNDNHGSFSPNVLDTFNTNSTNTGTLTITKFDKVNKIVSGTFSFKAVNATGEVVNITEGRFDRKFL